jgi:hypothetical protein
MSKYIKIERIIETPDDVEYEDLMDKFLFWLEFENNSYFGGGYYTVDEEGNPIN